MRNRVVLFAVTVLFWMALKALDSLCTGPEVLIILSVALSMMAAHSVWLYLAQTRRKSEGKLMHCSDASMAAAAEQWHPDVDIFISAKNESRVIETTVRNLFKLDYDKFLVWVIDDCSTDKMPEILERLKGEFANLRVINRKPGSYPGKSAALNEALALAKGDVVTVFDADAYVAPDFLKLALPILYPEKVGAVQAQKRMFEHQEGFFVHCQDSEYAMDTYFQVSRDLIGGAVELRGNGQLVKRQALIDVGGWNNRAITDDLDLSMRLMVSHWDIRFTPEAVVWEEAVGNLKGLLRQRRRWAEGSIRRYLDYIFPLNSPTRLSLVERLDTLVFTVYFVVPAMMLLEVTSEVVHLLTGAPTYGKLMAIVAMGIFFTTQINEMIARNFYRAKVPFYKAFAQSFLVVAYIYAHWVPVITFSLSRILFGKHVSTWHRTEHTGVAHRA